MFPCCRNRSSSHRGPPMTRAEEYRQLANTVRARAFDEESPILRAEWETLAKSYVRLAEQTDAAEQLDAEDPILGLLGSSRH